MGFVLSSIFIIDDEWLLSEYCWSIWISGLIYSWFTVLLSFIKNILNLNQISKNLKNKFVYLKKLSFLTTNLLVLITLSIIGLIFFKLYSYLFGFYGILLSVFAEMEPHYFFGRNGFINSDFFTPVVYLCNNFWPMILGTLIANYSHISELESSKLIFYPFESNITKIHIMTVLLPFLSLIFWMIFKEDYQIFVIMIFNLIFYLSFSKRKEIAYKV